MALINCPECNKEVSDTALACPHCGFAVAKYVDELRRKTVELQKAKEKQLRLERKQMEATAKKERKAAAKPLKSNHLKQYGKKSFWIFAFLLPYSVIGWVFPYIQDYLLQKQIGMIYKDDNMVSRLIRNVGQLFPTAATALFVILLIPCVLYVIANNVKNIKLAKVLLILGLMYTASLVILVIAADVNTIFVLVLGRTLIYFIPFCCYIVLYINAMHSKQRNL